jgi:hypothetical protein
MSHGAETERLDLTILEMILRITLQICPGRSRMILDTYRIQIRNHDFVLWACIKGHCYAGNPETMAVAVK